MKCWSGLEEPGIRVNFLGVKTRDYMDQLERHPKTPRLIAGSLTTTCLPDFDEEYFQWVDLVEAVSLAQGRFTMMELGAGFGRWLVNAAAVLQMMNGNPYRLIGVEAEPTHYQWLKKHIQDNDLDANSCELIQGAIDAENGSARFVVGRPSRWYGQSLWPPETRIHVPPWLKLLAYRLSRKRA